MGQRSSTLQNEEEALKKKLEEIEEKYRKKYTKWLIEAMNKHCKSLECKKRKRLQMRGSLASMPPVVWERQIGRYLPTISECDEDECDEDEKSMERDIVNRIEEEFRKKHYEQVIEIMHKYRALIEDHRRKRRQTRGNLASKRGVRRKDTVLEYIPECPGEGC